MDPIGASSTWRWFGYDNSMVMIDGVSIQSVSGGGHFGGGLFINSIDHARFGLLFLRNGTWKGKEIISSEWINKMKIPSENNDTYGYMWWLNRGERKWDDLSENIFYGSGFGGNYVVVVPDYELVIVVRWIDSSKIGDFVKKVIEAHK
jgi:CubicO group peptidase (beta-lactamase class C family)